MNPDKFKNPETITGFSTQPYLQNKVENRKYFDIQIPKNTEKSLNLKNNQLIEILVRNPQGKTRFYKKETSKRTGGLKFYLPRNVVEELSIEENDMLDVFIGKD